MDYKLKINNDEVSFITSAGTDFVRSTMPVGQAKGIIESGKAEKSDKFDGFEIKSGKYYFAGTVEAESEKPADEPKDDKDFITKEDYQKKKNKWHK